MDGKLDFTPKNWLLTDTYQSLNHFEIVRQLHVKLEYNYFFNPLEIIVINIIYKTCWMYSKNSAAIFFLGRFSLFIILGVCVWEGVLLQSKTEYLDLSPLVGFSFIYRVLITSKLSNVEPGKSLMNDHLNMAKTGKRDDCCKVLLI